MAKPLFTNDAVVLGILLGILSFVFLTGRSEHPFWKKFYKYVPTLLLCYFIPSIFNSLGIFSGESSRLYFVDLPSIIKLGPKALVMFFTGTAGIIIGGPLAIMVVSIFAPDIVGGAGPEAVWRGLTTVAGSWIGGGANQAAMKEIFNVGDGLFSAMIAVDVIVANIWLAFLLYGVGIHKQIDEKLQADTSAISELKEKIEAYRSQIMRIPDLTDTIKLMSVGFGVTAFAHFGSDLIAPWIAVNAPGLEKFSLTSGFFWLIVISTTIALGLSFTRARELEGIGASRYGSVFLYVLVATIGMKMDLMAIFENPGLFLVGLIWMAIHAILLIGVAKLIKAPFFFMAVGSQANVGGAASAPIVASAFHPSLAPVGVLLAVLGYAVGTYGAWFCGMLMQVISH